MSIRVVSPEDSAPGLPSRTSRVFNEFRGRTEYLRTTGAKPELLSPELADEQSRGVAIIPEGFKSPLVFRKELQHNPLAPIQRSIAFPRIAQLVLRTPSCFAPQLRY